MEEIEKIESTDSPIPQYFPGLIRFIYSIHGKTKGSASYFYKNRDKANLYSITNQELGKTILFIQLHTNTWQ